MNPGGETVIFEIGKGRFVLFGEGGGEKPSDHHVYVILFGTDVDGNFEEVFVKIFV